MKNKNYDIDNLLKNSLSFSEKPSEDLVQKVKYEFIKERNDMKKRRFTKPMVVAAALAAALSMSMVVFAAQSGWRPLQTRVIEGDVEFSLKVSEDGTSQIMSMSRGYSGRVVVEIEGEEQVISDPLIIDNLNEAVALFRGYNPMAPAYLPNGFVFENAEFFINPITNPDVENAGTSMVVTYSNSVDEVRLFITHFEEEGDFLFYWDSGLIEINIGDNSGHIGSSGLNLQIGNAVYFFSILDNSITQDDLIRMAESLRIIE